MQARLTDRLAEINCVTAAMRAGASLHLTHRPQSAHWALSTGARVTNEVAKLITAMSEVVDDGDGLFHETPQSWRWTS